MDPHALLRVRTATFDNLFEAVGVFASDGRLNLWNNRFKELWGLDEEQLATHPRVDTLTPLLAPKLKRASHAGLVRELVRSATTERKQRTGRVSLVDGREFEFAAVPLPDGNALFTMLDITDSRKVEAALRTTPVSPMPRFRVAAGRLPAGIELTSDGRLHGRPASAEDSGAVTIEADNGIAPPVTTTIEFVISPPR